MGTLAFPAVGGLLKGAERFAHKSDFSDKWSNVVFSRSRSRSFMLNCGRLKVGQRVDTSRMQCNGRLRLMPLNAWAGHSVPILTKYTRTGCIKRVSKSCPSTSMTFRCSLYKSSVQVLSADSGEESEDDVEEEPKDRCVEESLTMLGWPEICAQVAQFASTPMGISTAMNAELAIGDSRLQSEELLQQTAEACLLDRSLDFSGIEDLQSFLEGAMAGVVCQTKELCRVKNTLVRLQDVHDQLCGPHGGYPNVENCTSLQSLMLGSDLCSDLVSEIVECLDCIRDKVLDRASPALAATRVSRQANMRNLQAYLKETAGWIVQHGGMDSVIVTTRRTRLCIAIRSSHKALLPGGLVLDVSNTKTTSFMEPEPALKLNNEESRLAALEKAEEIAVLRSLTVKLVDKADAIMHLLRSVTLVDLACARASHAKWLQSVFPAFNDKLASSMSKGGVSDEEHTRDGHSEHLVFDIDGMRHPLLLGAALPVLPLSERYGSARPSNALQGSPRPLLVGDSSALRDLPVPIDIKVKSNIKVVTITGANTGGKTATMKALGIASVMAKAGLYLPAKGQPKLPWFDLVLGDVGDAQSLERSLSTFSGHIKRLCAIMEICTNESFILLDEVGSGTEPAEGAALAAAVLHFFCSTVALTIATTHSTELKTLKDKDTRFENASVEFDMKTLKPTYRVLWGVAGQSSALDIAESLGFDMKVLTRAREISKTIAPSELGNLTSKFLEPIMKQHNEMLERSRKAAKVLAKAEELHSELASATDNLPKRITTWRKLEQKAVLDDIASARLRMEQVVERFQLAMEDETVAKPTVKEARAEIAAIVEEYTHKQPSNPMLDNFSMDVARKGSMEGASGAPHFTLGDQVLVRGLGTSPVTITELPEKDAEILTVQLGTLNMKVKAKDVLRTKKPVLTPATVQKISYKPTKPSPILPSQTTEESSLEPKFASAVQTSKNTLDLRGMRVEDSIQELNMTLVSKSQGSVLFIIHGIGTGAVKGAVWQTLQKHKFVAKYEDESISNPGCTVVWIK